MVCSNATIVPWVLPITNIIFAGKTVSHRHAVPIEIGNPPRDLYLFPSVNNVSVTFADSDFCNDPQTPSACTAKYGGLYARGLSSTFAGITPGSWNGSKYLVKQQPYARYFNEKLQIGGSTMYGLPAAQVDKKTSAPNLLGLTRDSTFLAVAESMKLIPSRSWSLWTKRSNNTTGSLIIGGYDKARVKGNFTRFNIYTTSYNTYALVKTMIYNAPNGTAIPFLETSSGTDAVSFMPEDVNIRLGDKAWTKFAEVTDIIYYKEAAAWGWPAETELGNVTIVFGNGYSTTLPASDLWGDPWSGPSQIQNKSVTLSAVSKSADAGRNSLGYPFFGSNYLTFHPDENYFQLAMLNPDPDVQPNVQSFCNSTSSDGQRPRRSSKNAAQIAGAVIGAIAGILLIFAIIRLLLWYKKKRKESFVRLPKYTEMPASTEPGTYLLGKGSPELLRAELPLTQQRSELPSTDDRLELRTMPAPEQNESPRGSN